MKTVSYVCTHCGRRFEAEARDIVECPGCFWSTSVKPVSEIKEEATAEIKNPAKIPTSPLTSIQIPWKKAAKILLFVFLIVVIFLTVRILGSFLMKGKGDSIRITCEKAEQEAAGEGKSVLPAGGLLTNEQRLALNRVVEVSEADLLTAEAKNVLEARAKIKTGFVERLPSQIWTPEQFKEMLEEQERAYQMPLARSYRGKLQDLFEEKYVPAGEAFERGELLQARNLWIESLNYPIYANDLQKHRAVVLTMLRPLINDTLAKIGALNATLSENIIRQKELALQESYQVLLERIASRDWRGALEQINQLETAIQELEKLDQLRAAPPPYPDTIAAVDEGIRAALINIFQTSLPPIADLEPLKQDLLKKKAFLRDLIPENVERGRSHYLQAVEKIRSQEWEKAKQLLRNVDAPSALVRDARQKIQLIEKIQNTSLDSQTFPS